MNYQCNICQNTQNNTPYLGREMMFGTRDEFAYFKCPVCSCLQLAQKPESLDKYYPENYYSYQSVKRHAFDPITNFLIRASINLQIDKILPVYYLSKKYKTYHQLSQLWLQQVNKNASILDIGCGKGHLLQLLDNYGFKNLTGIDSFIDKDTSYDNGINIYKKEIYDVDQQFDFVMLHHSLEHMPEPHRVFAQLAKIVSDNGTILIRIPVIDGHAWRKYQMNWFQVDAPRHLFIHSVTSINMLAEKHGFRIESIKYDSTHSQFLNSEQYLRNIPLSEMPRHSNRIERHAFKKKTRELNTQHDGDQACFILKKKI